MITAQPDHKLRALKAGAKDFVSKPFDLAEVLMRVHNMLEVRLLHQESKRLYESNASGAEGCRSGCCSMCCPNPLPNGSRAIDITADTFTEVIADSFPEAR